jgi:ubiquinone/menaquinone biosynthesis C-methylase UbiE
MNAVATPNDPRSSKDTLTIVAISTNAKDQYDGAPSPYHKLGNYFMTRTAERHATHLLPHIKPHQRILDVGCGPGSITLDLAQLVTEGEVVGLDLSEGVLPQRSNRSHVTF